MIGRDGRLSGPSLATALSEGIRSTGCDVIDIGMVPTPVTYFATHHLDTGSAVKGHIIDIYMPSYEEAIEFGRQCVKVRVLRLGWHSDHSDTFSYGIAG